MGIYILLILSSLGLITANKFTFKTCPSSMGTINDVTSEPCVKSGLNECAFQEGNTQIMNITFTPDVEITEAHIVVTAFLGKLEIPYELPNGSVCENGLNCPLKPKEQQTFQTKMVMAFPPISLIVQFALKDNNNNTYGCFKAPVTIIPRNHVQNQMPNNTYDSSGKLTTDHPTLEKPATDNEDFEKLPLGNQSTEKHDEISSEAEDLSENVTSSNIDNQSLQSKNNMENSQLNKEENGSPNNTEYPNKQQSQIPVNQRNPNTDDKTNVPHPVETQNNDK